MTANEKGPIAGTPQEKASLKDYPELLAEIQALRPKPRTGWIVELDRQFTRKVVNAAIAGKPFPGVHILLDVCPWAAERGWSSLTIDSGGVRWRASVVDWVPGLKDINGLLLKLEPAVDPIEAIREMVGWSFGLSRGAQSLLTDGRAIAAQDLAGNSRAVWKAIGNVFEEARKPQNWANPIPADAQIEGLFCFAEDEDGGE